MADADGRVIPLVDDDQGEGVKDPLTLDDILELNFNEQFQEQKKELFKHLAGNEWPKKKNRTKPGGEPEARWVMPEDEE